MCIRDRTSPARTPGAVCCPCSIRSWSCQGVVAARYRPADDRSPPAPGGPGVRSRNGPPHRPRTSRTGHPDIPGSSRRRSHDVGRCWRSTGTKIVYCKDSRRRQEYEQVTFTFCGYAFRPRQAFDRKRKEVYTGFMPAVDPGKLTDVSRKAVSWRLQRRTTLTLDDLAKEVNPVLRGWLTYFTAFYSTAVIPLCKRMDRHLMRWARRKYKRLERSEKRTRAW